MKKLPDSVLPRRDWDDPSAACETSCWFNAHNWELEGQIIEPSVSDPNDTATKFAATDIADPLLDPHGSAERT